MDFVGLQYVISVADAGSFAAAARALNLHVSTLSRQIFSLENELGVTIFERGRSGIRLTSSGQAVLIYVRQVLADLDALANVSQLSGSGKNGHVHLGIGFPLINGTIKELILKWRHFHPGVGFTLHEMTENELSSSIKGRHIDVAILTEHALWPDVAFEPICTERLFAAVSLNHSCAKNTAVNWKALRLETILVQDWPHSHVTRSFYVSLLGPKASITAHPASKHSLLTLVSAGFGITLVTEAVAMAGFPGVTFIPIDEENAVVRHVLAWLPQSEDPAIGRFVAFMRDEARSLRSG